MVERLDQAGSVYFFPLFMKMEYKVELMTLLIFLTTVSSVAQSDEEFTEAVVRKSLSSKLRRNHFLYL